MRGCRPSSRPLPNRGIVPAYSYVILRKGIVELGTGACTSCHSRVLADGGYVPGTRKLSRPWYEQLRREHQQQVPNRPSTGLLLSAVEIERWTEGTE
jgi:hypothetical protein